MIEYGQFYYEYTRIKIDSLSFQIETIGNYARVKVIHVLTNSTNKSVTIRMTLNLDDESAVTGYSFTNNNGEFISVLKEKQQARKQKGVFKGEAFYNSDHINFVRKKENECQTEAIQILSKKKAESIRRKRG